MKLRVSNFILTSGLLAVFASSASATAVIYEPFDYAAGGLNGATGTSEVGFSGAWAANGDSKVATGTMTYGSLSTTGNKFEGPSALNRYGGSRAISTSALSTSGLLADGAELWFSVITGYTSAANVSNSYLTLALASGAFQTANGSGNTTLQAGEGVGIFLGGPQAGGAAGQVAAASYSSGANVNRDTTTTAAAYAAGTSGLVVGKIVWGALADTITLYQPDTSLNLGSAVSTLSTTVDQSTFDQLTFRWGERVQMDEIRFGASYADVTPSVPEPSAALLGAIGALALLRRRRN